MKYIQPYDQPSNPTAAYADLDAVHGVDGSIPPARFFNVMQAEILSVITHAGLTPSDTDLSQLYEAIIALMPTVSGPSDASLVHYAVDSGGAGAISLTPSIGMAGCPAGSLILFVPAADSPGATNVTLATSGGSVVKALLRDDASALANGDVKAGRLSAIHYDGTRFRLVWCARAVAVDGVTITGAGLPGSPLVAVQQPNGPGVQVNQFIDQYMHAGGGNSPAELGFVAGVTTASGAALTAGAVVVAGHAAAAYQLPINTTGVPGIAGYGSGAGPWHSESGALSGTWQLDSWLPLPGFSPWGYAFRLRWIKKIA